MSRDTTGSELPLAPWILVDDNTVGQTVLLLERLTEWLQSANPKHARSCADALSLGETDLADSIAGWTDALAARLQRCADGGEL